MSHEHVSSDTDNVFETLSMKERLQQVRELRHQYGDDVVPQNELAELGFAQEQNDDGVTAYVSFEHIASRGIMNQETGGAWLLPQTVLTAELPVTTTVGARIDVRELRDRLAQLKKKLYGNYDGRADRSVESRPYERIYGVSHPALDILQRHNELVKTSKIELGAGFEYALGTFAEPGGSNLGDPYTVLDDADYDLQGKPLKLDVQTTTDVLASLQRLRSSTGDLEVLETSFEAELQYIEGDDNNYPYPGDRSKDISHHTAILAKILTEDGFPDAAEVMKSCLTLRAAQDVIAAAIENNHVKMALKDEERQWQLRRKSTSDENTIHELSAERSRMREDAKAKQRTLYGIDGFLHIARHYKQTAKAAIKNIEDALVTNSEENSTISIEFQTKPDAVLDVDPGRVSGDCTAGESLKFGRSTGLHNVRVVIDGKHTGNIYLLEATADKNDDETIWHLDAIQIPNRHIDWEQFPQMLLDTFVPLAQEAGVSGISINQKQHHVSNYDYISHGFMKYFGTEQGWKPHDSMEQLDESVKVVSDDTSRHCKVNFDTYLHNISAASRLQGISDDQVWLWRVDQRNK